MMKKNVLVFGDSNTWGWNPANNLVDPITRWDDDVRWTGVAQALLGDGYNIINQGLNGRTTVWDDPIEEYRCGKDQIVPAMDIAAPLDLVIIFVGTNDLKVRYTVSAQDIANGVGILVDKALHQAGAFGAGGPKVLLIGPPALGPIENSVFQYMFEGNVEKSKHLGTFYEGVAATYGVEYFDADIVVHSSAEDGLHLQDDQHLILGEALAAEIKRILG
ncbi:GDSL-type esterase/lipase family protein [Eubacterium aggregans]|uniref:GDSL-type esterase/lipase family protein n=1 Tax=Eubacterium aggregans TaxID=81409 RepID=UPI002B2133AC|nr:GDSL-type esterase/lipase family protein [Eubacterium aggregans]